MPSELIKNDISGLTKTIGLVRLSAIGDITLTTAVIDFFNRLKFNLKVIFFTTKPSIEMIKSSFPEVECIDVHEYDSLTTLTEVFKSIEILIDLQNTTRSSRVIRPFKKTNKHASIFYLDKQNLFRTKLILQAKIFGRRRNVSTPALISPKTQMQKMLETASAALLHQYPKSNPTMVSYIKEQMQKARPILKVAPTNQSWSQELQFGIWLGISLGASHATKKAPTLIWKDLLSQINQALSQRHGAAHHPVGLLALGSTDERRETLDFLASLNWSGPILPLVGKLTLLESSQALKNCSLYLGNDSGVAHIAEALKVPVGVLFGPTVEGFGFAPWGSQSRAFSTSIGCRPCSRHGKTACRYGDKKCFYGINLTPIKDFSLQNLTKEPSENV